MSERGSLITQFIYCPDCLQKIKSALENSEDFESLTLVANYIIAAKTHAQWAGGEYTALQNCFDKDNAPCHNVRFAIHSDKDISTLLELFPDGHFETIKSAVG